VKDGCCKECNFDCIKEGKFKCHSNPCQACSVVTCKYSSRRFVMGKLPGAWCPICFSKMEVSLVDAQVVTNCPRHGEMIPFLDHDPALGAASLVKTLPINYVDRLEA
jgi:hypothetical protein